MPSLLLGAVTYGAMVAVVDFDVWQSYSKIESR